MNKIKVMITGGCGVTSRSIVRSLRKSDIIGENLEIIGTDVCDLRYGLYEGLYDKLYKVPRYDDPLYRDHMQKIIDNNKIEYAFVIPELEALEWSKNPFGVKFMKIPPCFSEIAISKISLYEVLANTGMVPKFQVIHRNDSNLEEKVALDYPVWVRDCQEGSTSGRGAFLAESDEELCSWLMINKKMEKMMASEYLPGRNLACFLSYSDGELVQYGVAERITYLMGKVAISGITGNTSYGRLLNDENVVEISKNAVNTILEKTKEVMNGLVVVDLKEDANGKPKVTEINLRHVAFTSTFASAGLNFSETQLLLMMGERDKVVVNGTIYFPKDNAMLRDVDGLPLYVSDYRDIRVGEYVSCSLKN